MISTLEELSLWVTHEAITDTQLKIDCQEAFWANPTKDLGRVMWVVTGCFEEVDWAAIE